MIFQREGASQYCYIVELKDGHEFDTKSSAKEHQNLHDFLTRNAGALQWYQSYCKIVGFNATTQEEIQAGFKNRIAIEQAMTGRQFCELLGLDHAGIVQQRTEDAAANFENFLDELVEIPRIRDGLGERLD